MNMLQEKIATLKRRSDLNRSRWNPIDMPVLSGWPLRNYRWWQQQTGYAGHEDLCHFIRVALVWGPLRWVTQPFRRLRGTKFGIYALQGIVGLLALTLEGILYAKNSPQAFLAVNGAVIGAALAIWGLVVLTSRFGRQLQEAVDWFIYEHPARLPWLRPWLIVPAALIGLAAFVPIVRMALLMFGVVVVVMGILLSIGWLADKAYVSSRRRQERARKEEFLRELFAQLHPDRFAEPKAYIAWRERYIQWRITLAKRAGLRGIQRYDDITIGMLRDNVGILPYSAIYAHMSAQQKLRDREADKMLQEQLAAIMPKRPSPLRRILRPISQFFQLLWTFAVLWKKKACPIIELPDEPRSYR